MNIVVVGSQWGDEGKGKLIDVLSKDLDITVRYQGGSNAGHTVVVGDKSHVFHLLPSAILHLGKVCVIGNGVVVDPKALLEELDNLSKEGIKVNADNFKISGRCHIVMPYHKMLDSLKEGKRTNKIGTTGKGIGPCYSDKVNRCGIRLIDLLNPNIFKQYLKENLVEKEEVFAKFFDHKMDCSLEDVYEEYIGYGNRLKEFVCDTAVYINEQIEDKKSILFEGAQGTFLDIDFGTYPFVTSSNSTVGGVCSGTGVAPTKIDKVVACVKAYTTRVGEGPFPTEFTDEMKDEIQKKGNEFGATTGRPRRCGWFDSVLVRHSVIINGSTELAIMKLDVLEDLEYIKICTAYEHEGKVFKDFPMDFDLVRLAKPVYEEMPGWQLSIQGINRYDDLPDNAKKYLMRLEELLKVKVKYISTGTKRDEIIFR